MKKLVTLAVLVLAGGFVAPSSAVAGDTICPPTASGSHDNILVPPGLTCFVTGATVKGNIKALENAQLFVSSSTVGGNIEGDKAEVVQVVNSTVGGNITIKEGEIANAGPFDAAVCGVTLTNGNISIEKMTGDVFVGPFGTTCGPNTLLNGNIQAQENVIPMGSILSIVGNSVDGNLQVFKNTGPGSKTVVGNTVRENLQCKENTPPFVGGPNIAGDAEDQCF